MLTLDRMPRHLTALLLALGALSCISSEPSMPGNAVDVACRDRAPIALAVGQDTTLTLTAARGCLVLPGAAGEARRYAIAAYSGSGLVLPSGQQSSARFASGEAPAVLASNRRTASERGDGTARLHAALRSRESRGAAAWRAQPPRTPTALEGVRPQIGDRRSFLACADLDCAATITVGAVARQVGRHIAVYVDTLSPADGFTSDELVSAVQLFDDQLFPIDTLAFGAPSDVDGNGVVIALLTPAVNALSGPGCSNGIVLGYFDGTDLLVGTPGSNNGEVFFNLVPDPASSVCRISRNLANEQLPVTFIHELQHMISFRQHVLVRAGATESVWLNEALSHYAEELGARAIPDAPGAPPRSRFSQFAIGNVDNAYGFLLAPEQSFLVFPSTSSGSPEERGAAWLFLRWLADQFTNGTETSAFTRSLLATNRTGAANVAQVTGRPFDALVGRWLMASYLDDLPNVRAATDLQFTSWNFRQTFASLNQQDPGRYPRVYPVTPVAAGTTPFARRLTLRGGSGVHALAELPAGATRFTLQLSDTLGAALSALAEPRAIVVRLQ